MLPNFLHVGAAKVASTWLYRVCLEHPEIYSPPANDNLNFFLSCYHRGLGWYEETYFGEYVGEKVAIDFSNGYMVSETALERIAADLPGAKLTMTLRDPVERAYIHWAYEKRKRQWTEEQGMRIDMVFHPNRWQFFRQWMEPSLYGACLKRIFRLFDRERVKVMFYEDLVADPGRFVADFFGFLEVDVGFVPEIIDQRRNPDLEEEDISLCPAELREELGCAVRDDVLLTQELTGRDLSGWLGTESRSLSSFA